MTLAPVHPITFKGVVAIGLGQVIARAKKLNDDSELINIVVAFEGGASTEVFHKPLVIRFNNFPQDVLGCACINGAATGIKLAQRSAGFLVGNAHIER